MKWQENYRLGNNCRIKHGFPFKSSFMTTDKDENLPIVVNIVNFQYTGGFRFDSTKVQRYLGDYPKSFELRPSDILLVMTCQTPGGEILGIPGKIPDDGKTYLHNQRMGLVEVNEKEKLDLGFLYYLFLSKEFNKHLYATATGAKILHTAPKRIEDYKFLRPPPETQKRIASALSAYDDLIENNFKRIKLLEESAQLLYTEWFVNLRFPGHEHVNIVDGIPEKWETRNVFKVTEVLSGGTPKTSNPEYWGDEIPFFTPKDARDNSYVLETEKNITGSGLNNCNSKLYPKNTVFITARGTVGKIVLAQKNMAMNQSCYALIGKPGIPQFFLFLALRSAVKHFKQVAVGGVFDTIIVDTFRKIPFLKPSPLLISEFEEMVRPVFQQVENLLLQNQKLREARDLLLPRLMDGTIEV